MNIPKFVAHFEDDEGKWEAPIREMTWNKNGVVTWVTIDDPHGGSSDVQTSNEDLIKIEQI